MSGKHTWHKLSPARRSRIHSWPWSVRRRAAPRVLEACRPPLHPPILHNARTESERFPGPVSPLPPSDLSILAPCGLGSPVRRKNSTVKPHIVDFLPMWTPPLVWPLFSRPVQMSMLHVSESHRKRPYIEANVMI